MSNKLPKTVKEISVSKNPKFIEDPNISFGKQFASWQLSFIDIEGNWGLNKLRSEIDFSVSDELLKELNGAGNDLTDALFSLTGKTFKDLDDFLEKLQRQSKNDITPNQQRIIIRTIQENVFWRKIFPKLKHFETKTWIEIEKEQYGKNGKTKHHFIAIEKIIEDAQRRLKTLNLNDIDELFSIRLDGELRIWGIRKSSYLQVLWFDFQHEICPPQRS